MKSAIYLIVLLYFTSCTWSGLRNPSAIEIRGRHIIITLHGVRGNDQSYGDFHKIIKSNLEKLDPAYSVETVNWTYPVGEKVVETKEKNGRDYVWSPHEISKKFNQDLFLGERALISNLGPNDKISLIAYSMGGLMAMSWYYDTMLNFSGNVKYMYSADEHALLLKRLEKVENIIGLGAVYWGSLDAELGWSFLENGSLGEIKKTLPKIKQFCELPEVQKVIEGESLLDTAGSTFTGWLFGKKDQLTLLQKNEKFVKDAVLASCKTAQLVQGNYLLNNIDSVSGAILKGIKKGMASVGNVSPKELDNMRLTSDVINEMRVGRIKHVLNEELRNRFKARWTSIVGVFPCLGKKDKGLTCAEFSSEDYKRVNEGLVTLFSGLFRRETDGPVMSPSAVADFLFYVERPGNESADITPEQFQSTQQIQKTKQVDNKEIFVENMHATVVPALEALSGSLQSVGASGATAMKNFDSSLGVDVVIVNKECSNPATCEHPNYKHMLQTLANCDGHSSNVCNEEYMNQFYHVGNNSLRMLENNKLKEELGSFVLTFNIRLPKNLIISEDTKKNLISNLRFKIPYVNYGSGPWGDNRIDAVTAPYGIQLSRKNEIISSYAYLTKDANNQVLRAFFVGRAWGKPGRVAEAKQQLNTGVPVSVQINIPGVKVRQVTARVKPTYTTYVDMYMK